MADWAAVIESQTRDAVRGQRARQFHKHPVPLRLRAGKPVQQQRHRHAAASVRQVEHADNLLTFRFEDDGRFHIVSV